MPIVLPGFNSAAYVQTTQRSFATLLDGESKSGKTRFAMTWPKPIYHFNFDRDGWTVYKELPEEWKPQIHYKNYWVDIDTQKADTAVQNEACSALLDFRQDYNNLLMQLKITGETGTIFLDTQSTLYAMVRFADFGRLEKVMARDYGEVNTIMEGIFQRAAGTNAYLVASARIKEKWAGGQGTGVYVPKGFSEVHHVVQAEVRCYYLENQTNKFCAQIMRNAFNPAINGAALYDDMINFDMLKAVLLGG